MSYQSSQIKFKETEQGGCQEQEEEGIGVTV